LQAGIENVFNENVAAPPPGDDIRGFDKKIAKGRSSSKTGARNRVSRKKPGF
jgi:hypothetical protein